MKRPKMELGMWIVRIITIIIFIFLCSCTVISDQNHYTKGEIDSLLEVHDTAILTITDYDDSLLFDHIEKIQKVLDKLEAGSTTFKMSKWGVIIPTTNDSIKEFHWKNEFPIDSVVIPDPIIPDTTYQADTTNHAYPRTAVFTWGGATADWYSKFDLIYSWNKDTDLVRQIKALNPQIWVVNTADWNTGAYARNDLPEEFRLKNSEGSYLGFYEGLTSNPEARTPNFSEACPIVNGEKCYQWFARYVVNRVDMNVFDGVGTDGWFGSSDFLAWRIPVNANGYKDIDLNNNGINDLDEYDLSWVLDQWVSGSRNLLKEIRKIIGNKIIIVNSGMGFAGHPAIWNINGGVIEYFGGEASWDYQANQYKGFMETAMKPNTIIFQTNPHGDCPLRPENDKNFFSFMRSTLVRCMLGNGYYHFEPDQPLCEHYYNKYYDEFDLEFGYPTSNMTEKNNMWIRFFNGGVVLYNNSKTVVTITDSDLYQMDYYDGPYYKFRGGQDPVFNNGELITEITLNSQCYNDWECNEIIIGGSAILVNTPVTVISDIIIDDCDAGTSPASEPAEFYGDWTAVYKSNNSWQIRASEGHGLTAYHISKSENSKVIFRPTIGVAGNYEIFEWQNGEWNSLGIDYFEIGNGKGIERTGNGIIADAIKFVYRED